MVAPNINRVLNLLLYESGIRHLWNEILDSQQLVKKGEEKHEDVVVMKLDERMVAVITLSGSLLLGSVLVIIFELRHQLVKIIQKVLKNWGQFLEETGHSAETN